MAVISTGQITIVDYNDAVSLSGYISANQVLTQIYNPDNSAYSPSYATTNMVLTPSLFASVTGANDVIASANITSIKWFDGTTEIVTGGSYILAAFTTGQNRPLTIKANILTGSTMAKTFRCEVTYVDTHTAASLIHTSTITISRVNNGGGAAIAQIVQPDGNVFKNGGGTSLRAEAQLLRSAGNDTTNNTYKWYRLEGASYVEITSANAAGITGYTTATITIPATAVDGLESFKAEITDTDPASGTTGQKFPAFATFIDQTDPIQVNMVSSAGDVLKNGVGSTVITARLFQSGAEIDAYVEGKLESAYTYIYKWYRSNKDGTPDANFGGASIAYKTGKRLTVDQSNVDVKATFTVEVESR